MIVEKLADGGRPGVGPPAFLTDRRQVGFSDLVTDPDGVTRRGLLLLWNERGEAFVSFSLRLALRALHPEGLVMGPHPDDPNWIRLGRTPLPPVEPDFGGYEDAHAGGYQVLIDFRRANGSFPSAAT